MHISNKGLFILCNFFSFFFLKNKGSNGVNKWFSCDKDGHLAELAMKWMPKSSLCMQKDFKFQKRFKTSSRDEITIGVLPLERNET